MFKFWAFRQGGGTEKGTGGGAEKYIRGETEKPIRGTKKFTWGDGEIQMGKGQWRNAQNRLLKDGTDVTGRD